MKSSALPEEESGHIEKSQQQTEIEQPTAGAESEVQDYAKQVIRGTYLPHIDGIRAVAVIPVLLYHLCATLCPGGYSGVDVFFVISGYLIGGGIINDLQKGEFSFCAFYTRRIKRIMPAYFAMIIAALTIGLLIYHYEPLKSLGNASLRSSYFFANFFCYKFLGDYFAGDAELHPLINLWSLSVEEQFYIVTPLLMWALWKLRSKAILMITLCILMAFSFIHAEQLLNSESDRNLIKGFYMLLPRAWELLAGVALACFPLLPIKETSNKALRIFLGSLGFALTIGAYILLNKESHFPGYGALCSVAGCALMIRFGAYGWVGAFLSAKPTVGIGRISYSLYLWHWPIIAFMHYIFNESLSISQMLFAAFLSFLLAIGSWKFIEMPVRRAKKIGFKTATIGLLITCGITGGIGSLLYKTDGLVDTLHQEANRHRSTEYPRTLETLAPGTFGITQLDTINDKGHTEKNVIKHLGNKNEEPDFVLIGDSHAEAMQIGLDDICKEYNRSGLAIGVKTCPLLGIEITNTFANVSDPFLSWLQQTPQIKTVIIVCRWNTRLSGASVSQKLYKTGGEIPADTSANTALLEEGIVNTCKHIKALGRNVVILGPTPVLKLSPGSEIRRRIMLGLDTSDMGDGTTQDEFEARESDVIGILERLQEQSLAKIVMVHPVLFTAGKYRGFIHGKLMYHDDNHLSGEGSRYVVKQLYPQIFASPW
ncbi:MAG: acyltransferase [Akkermansia sp.]|nr:acyltransferase [Akkermansia sp.]